MIASIMTLFLAALCAQEKPAPAKLTPEIPSKVEESVLLPNTTIKLKVREIFSPDGLSPGERLLNGLPALQKGDRFIAEIDEKREIGMPPVLVGGTITNIELPSYFRKHGKLTIEVSQLISAENNEVSPWRVDMEDNRFTTKMRRNLLNSLFIIEGATIGASVGAQYTQGGIGVIGIGTGAGLLLGLAYAGIQKGSVANLEPGDIFEVKVGTLQYRPVTLASETRVFPATTPYSSKKKKP